MGPEISGRVRIGLAALFGAFLALGQAPFGILPLAMAGLSGAFLLIWSAPRGRAAFWTGWTFGAAAFAVSLHWIVEPFFVDVQRHGWMAPFALLFMAGGLALFWGLAAAAARRIGQGPVGFVLALSGALTLAEWLRGWVLTGFPWASIGHIWAETGWIALAAYVGTPGLTLLAALVGGLAFLMAKARHWLVAPAVGLVLGGVLFFIGPYLQPTAGPAATDRPVVRLVQPNAPQDEKWDPAHVLRFYERQLDATRAPGDPDLVVWPETSIPWTGADAEIAFDQIAQAAGGAPVVVGYQRWAEAGVFNSLVLIGPGGGISGLYDKHHLVPFGEYMPLSGWAAALGLQGLATNQTGGFSPGPGPRVMDIGTLGTALPLICYEMVFPRNISAAEPRPDFLLHITNDAWFGQTAGPQQHLAQARLRAVEFGLPVIRAANTGISAVIDPGGTVLASIPLGEAGFVDHPIPRPAEPTIYARTGNIPIIVLALVLFAAGLRPSSAEND